MRRIVLLFAMLILAVGTAVPAQAHDQGWDSVSPTEYLVWQDLSKYDVAAAMNDSYGWQGLQCWAKTTSPQVACPGVSIDQWGVDSGVQPLNLQVWDMYAPSEGYNGKYSAQYDPDRIYLNTYHIDRAACCERWRGTINHEFGHALGWAHPPITDYYIHTSIMIASWAYIPYPGWLPNRPGPHESVDYYYSWTVRPPP